MKWLPSNWKEFQIKSVELQGLWLQHGCSERAGCNGW